MPTPLASIFSTIDSTKRKLFDALMNPMDTLRNAVDDRNLAAKEHLQQLDGSGNPLTPRTPEQQANLDAVIETLANGYNPAGIFAGARAKGIDSVALAYAMKDARKGRNPAEIWNEHGWAKGPDGFWRTEINDAHAAPIMERSSLGMVRHGRGEVMGALEDSFEHDKFAKAYPDIWKNSAADLQVHTFQPGDWAEGSFSRFGGNMAGGDIRMAAGSERELKKGVLHELQHAVQSKEGFTGGGSPSMFMRHFAGFPGVTDLQAYQKAVGMYQRLGGEAEARMVESRANMPELIRPSWYPYNPDYFENATGVPLDSLITQTGRPLIPR